MSITDQLMQAAAALGADHGHAAGTWVIDGNTTVRTCAVIVRMYDDGDPALWDVLPSSPLSGEWADSMTPRRLYREIMGDDAADEWENTQDPAADDILDSLCDAYEEAWQDAMVAEVIRAAAYQVNA